MRRSFLSRFANSESAAIAPLYAIGITAIVVMSAVGFDYGRLMALDTELQNAADQAALSAATQLDGGTDAMTRARNAATATFATASSQYVNETRFANDNQGRPITSLTYRFFDGYTNDQMGTLLTSDSQGNQARVVEVTVNARQVFYALTPLVGAINSGDVIGRALAGLETGTCNVAPMFFCVPKDSSGNNILTFPRAEDIGHQILLHLRNSESETFTPGNFGFLDVPYGTNSQQNVKLGLNTSLAGCFAATPDQRTVPGERTPMGRSLNTRLDVFESPLQRNDCDSSGNFCPSANVTRDWVNIQVKNQNQPATCASTPPNGSNWIRVSAITDATTTLSNPGYPDDTAFSGVLGNGNWGSSAWMTANHPSNFLTDIPDANGNGSISRYEAFLWELGDPSARLQPRAIGMSAVGTNNKYNLYCAYPQPTEAPAWPASATQKDRRILTVGAVACENGYPNGTKNIQILRWIDLFLTRPMNGSSETEFVTEVIGPGKKPNGDSGFQYFGKKRAVLIR